MQTSQLIKRFILLAAATACLLVIGRLLGPPFSEWQQRRIAYRLVAKLEQTESDNSRVVLRQIASLGNSSIGALVAAAASEQADVALQARQIIDEMLGTWKTTAEANTEFDLGVPTRLLAQALAEQITRFGPLGQQWSSDLALQLVEIAEQVPAEDATFILADCSLVLERVPAVGTRMRTIGEPRTSAAVLESHFSTRDQPDLALLSIPSEQAIASPPSKPTVVADAVTKSPSQGTDFPGPFSRPLQVNPQKSPLESTIESLPTKPEFNTDRPPDVTELEISSRSLIEPPAPDEMESQIAAMRTQSTRALLERLAVADFFATGAIRLVLYDRGITDEELSLVERLLSSDPADRLRLVQDLKVLPARTARRWLRELLGDDNAEVRLQALTALATSNDPKLVGLAREMAVSDQDARVSELAARIIREAR